MISKKREGIQIRAKFLTYLTVGPVALTLAIALGANNNFELLGNFALRAEAIEL